MAYTQKPGRGNNPKTGHGIPTPLRQIGEKVIAAGEQAAKIVKGRKSLKDFSERELGIERGAATDSILAANPKDSYLFTKKERERMGNVAAEATRKVNKAGTTVKRGEKFDSRTGYSDTYKRTSVK